LRWVTWALLGAAVACSGPSPTSPSQLTESGAPPKASEGPQLADIGKACTPESPATVLEGPRLDSLPLDWRLRRGYTDEIWVTLAREAPGGIGGMFFDRGVGYLWLVDPSKRSEAIAAIAAAGIEPIGFALQDAVVLKARWNFAQLAEWHAYVTSRALLGVEWSYADIQEGRNRLEYGVVDEAALRSLESRLKRLDLPCNLIAVEIRPPLIAL
jgi:hypothetical protein